MSELANISSTDIVKFSRALQRLEDHVGKNSASVQKAVEELAILKELSNYRRFSDIGESFESWHEILVENYSMQYPLGISVQLKSNDKDELEDAVKVLNTRFSDRLSEVIPITPGTDLPVSKLRRGALAFMNLEEEVAEKYEDEIKDLDEACISVLCGTMTSSEFISLRAVEGIMRKWHSEQIDEEKEFEGWYDAIDDISESEYAEGPDILPLLEYLRTRRNEVAHPDRFSNRKDAERSLQYAIDVVETLIEDLERGEGDESPTV